MLSEDIKVKNKLHKSKTRFDCVASFGQYTGVTPFISTKGMLFLYLTKNRDFQTSAKKPQYSLTGQGLNFTGLIPTQHPDVFIGYPNNKDKLSNGQSNPTYRHKDDLFLIVKNKNLTKFEVLIFPDGKPNLSVHLESLLSGKYKKLLEKARQSAVPFFNYIGYGHS